MRMNIYPKIAFGGISKNKRIYIPYAVTGAVMTMMFYILSFLMETPALEEMGGGSVLMSLLPFACGTVAVFSLLFMFYTNSFLVKQRYRELGLYSVLGMNKRNISAVMAYETLFTALASISTGLFAGILLSKSAELVLLNMLDMEISFGLSVGVISLRNTVLVFSAIYLLLLVNSVIKVRRSKPVELMQSQSAGEKIPRHTWIFAVLGVICLGAAYALAVSIKEPVTALFWFFAAVILVIIGTYLLFISGSVALCLLLRKNKKYYYKAEHFVSVSSMTYRMKRNGAGLASICILLTMVLVMLSSTASLYFGEEDALKNRYPSGVNIKIYYDRIDGISDENLDRLRGDMSAYCEEGDLGGMRTCAAAGMFTEDGITIDYTNAEHLNYDKVGYLFAVPLEDYNRATGESRTLEDGECFICNERLNMQWSTFEVEYGNTYTVKETLEWYTGDADSLAMTMPSVYIVVKDIYSFAKPISDLKNESGYSMLEYIWSCGFDASDADRELEARDGIEKIIKDIGDNGDIIRSFYVQSREAQRENFFEIYGSLFFIGIMLGAVFLFAAVLIIYYKQISEGYEDRKRFEIMRKVGMTKGDIRRSINSQLLTVFFMPLVLAGLHLAFAFPFISKILTLFMFDNTLLNIAVNAACFAVFGSLYALVYKITSGVYYKTVSV